MGYYTLRTRSLEGLAYAIEPQILDELDVGSGGMADLLYRSSLGDTHAWGVFDQHTSRFHRRSSLWRASKH